MSYRSLLLHLDDQPHAAACAYQAALLAIAFQGRLVGLSCRQTAPWPSDGAMAFMAGDPVTLELQASRRAALARELAFSRRCARAGLESFETASDVGDPAAAIAGRALAADLVVMGQADPAHAGHEQRRALLDAVLRRSVRPVLVLPWAGTHQAVAGPLMIGWDESACAARAVSVALPLLRRARAVHLVLLETRDDRARERLRQAARWLARHGIVVHPRVRVSDAPAGRALLHESADVGATLLVMGAWGRRSVADRLLGSATRAVVEQTALPVLFAH
jgi:nucleotide-binding universal stress UspA family protein